MTDIKKGGRGNQAPYESTHARIPEPIKKVVNMFADKYRQLVGAGVTDPTVEKLIRRVEDAICAYADDAQKPVNAYSEPGEGVNGFSHVDELRERLAALEEENGRLREQLEEWQEKAEEATELRELERSQQKPVNPEAIALLQKAITPKEKGGTYDRRNGSPQKKAISEALKLLGY